MFEFAAFEFISLNVGASVEAEGFLSSGVVSLKLETRGFVSFKLDTRGF